MEGLNQAGYLGRKLMIILNDNEMSISPNVGAMQGYLNRIIHGQPYRRLKDEIERFLLSIPKVGEGMLKLAKQAEHMAKQLLVPGVLFEELGFKYVGPINGHSLPQLVATLRECKDYKPPGARPRRHAQGQGVRAGRGRPGLLARRHAVLGRDRRGGQKKPGPPSYTKVFAETLDRARQGGPAHRRDHRRDARGHRPRPLRQGVPRAVLRRRHLRAARGHLRGRPRDPRPCARWWRSTRRSCSAPTTRSSTTSA